MIFAVIPAAGKSSRMGRPKLALPVGGKRVLELVVEALRQGGVDQVLVVLAPHAAELRPMAESAGANVLMLDEETPDMRATVVAGLGWLDRTFHPGPGDFWFLVPAEAGNVVLFESWLRHEVPANPVAAHRVSISFNYNWF